MAATSYVGDSPLFLLDFVLRFLRVAVLLSIWWLLLAGRGIVSGLALPAVRTYTLIAEVFAEQLTCRTGLVSAFWDGTIATRFVRPLGVFTQFAAEMFGKWAFGFAFFSLPLLLCAPMFGVNPLPASALSAALYPLSLALGIAVGLALEYCFAALAVGMEAHPYALDNVRAAIGTVLTGAELIGSEDGRHEYRFDASQVTITALLEQAAEQAQVLDVETHRAPIDDVIADIYKKWQGSGTAGPGISMPGPQRVEQTPKGDKETHGNPCFDRGGVGTGVLRLVAGVRARRPRDALVAGVPAKE